MYNVHDDVKRFEEHTATFEKTAFTLSLLDALLWIWVQTPHLSMNPAAAGGFGGITGFNVGHAIVMGPLVVPLTIALCLSLLARREFVRRSIAAQIDDGHVSRAELSPVEVGILRNYAALPVAGRKAIVMIDRFVRGTWFFALPLLASFALLRRFCDLLPSEEIVPLATSKTWTLGGRVVFLFGSWAGFGMRPVLAHRDVESNAEIAAHLPWIYPPVQGWLYAVLFCGACWAIWKGAILYFCDQPEFATQSQSVVAPAAQDTE